VGQEMLREIRAGPQAAERREAELFARLYGWHEVQSSEDESDNRSLSQVSDNHSRPGAGRSRAEQKEAEASRRGAGESREGSEGSWQARKSGGCRQASDHVGFPRSGCKVPPTYSMYMLGKRIFPFLAIQSWAGEQKIMHEY